MDKFFYFFIFLNIFKICSSAPSCKEGKNNCISCHPLTHLCVKCDLNIYIPDENGGCQYSKKCIMGNNYCFECSEKENICKTCEKGYYPDENGGCSYINNCEISYKGECLKCIGNFILIGVSDGLKICKSLDSEDFNNCDNINYENGLCLSCKEGYYLNSGDKKCIQTENCTESAFGICKKCNSGYYLDKQQNKCLLKTESFINCMQTIDGKTCDKCEENYFFDSENNCINTIFCEKGKKNGECQKCISGKYLTYFDKSCTNEKNCFFGISDIGICEICNDGYYMDFRDGICKSYDENEEFKYCRKADNGICYECIAAYVLGEDNKCSKSKNCIEIENGICVQCIEGYHLGLDNICTNVEYCIYSSPFFDKCIECEDNYYFDNSIGMCIIAEEKFKNCKNGNKDLYCQECKNNFYLDQNENLCYSNKLKGKFYKCALSDRNGEYCIKCEKDYFLSYNNNLCINTDGCNIAQDENVCLECNEYHCLDIKTGKCEINQFIEKEEQKIFFRCNRTNEEGNACEECKDDYMSINDGICVDDLHCSKKDEDGSCLECQNDENGNFCLNPIYKCVETYNKNCLECSDIFNLDKCSKCIDGYEINEIGECIEIE